MKTFSKISHIALAFCALGIMEPTSGRRTRTTTSTTTEVPTLTVADREANLIEREEHLRERERAYREREDSLAKRETDFMERENKLSTREANLAIREQNTLRGSCSDKSEVETPAPDYTLVRFDEISMKYHDIGSTSECSQNMRFFAHPDNETSGDCDCDFHECSRPLLYSDKYKQCFWAWSKGPCEQGEWYVYNESLVPECKMNPCPESPELATPSYYFLNPTDEKCYKAGTKGFCTKRGERLLTAPDAPIPSCRTSTVCYPLSVPATQECIPGNKRYFDGLCDDSDSE